MGFLQICSGVILLQLSKSAKDIPDVAVFKGDLDQVRIVAEQEEPESEPKADAIRGTAAIIRRFSNRQKAEAAEAKRVHEERLKDRMIPIGEDEQYEWDGLRRRKTVRIDSGQGLERRKTLHPPLGMAYFPDEEDDRGTAGSSEHGGFDGGFLSSFRKRAQDTFSRGQSKHRGEGRAGARGMPQPGPTADMSLPPYQNRSEPIPSLSSQNVDGAMEMSHVLGLPQNLHRQASNENIRPVKKSHVQATEHVDDEEEGQSPSRGTLAPYPPPHTAKRQFSFQNVFHRRKSDTRPESSHADRRSSPRLGIGSRQGTKDYIKPSASGKSGTEEERLGLVKGDSQSMLPSPDYTTDDEESPQGPSATPRLPHLKKDAEKKVEDFDAERQSWIDSGISPERGVGGGGGVSLREEAEESDEEESRRRLKEWEGHSATKGAFI